MKVSIYGGEGFPLYEIYPYDETPLFSNIEVDEKTLERWRQAFDNFSKVQKEITEHLENQNQSDKVWANGIWNGFNL